MTNVDENDETKFVDDPGVVSVEGAFVVVEWMTISIRFSIPWSTKNIFIVSIPKHIFINIQMKENLDSFFSNILEIQEHPQFLPDRVFVLEKIDGFFLK